MKRALVFLMVSVLVLTCVAAKTKDDSLRFGFEGGFGKNWTNAETLSDARLVKIMDNGFYGDAVIEYHLNDSWALKLSAGAQYQRKAEVEDGETKYKLDKKTGLAIEAGALIRYNIYKYEGFSLFASLGAEAIMSTIGPENETYSRETLTNLGFGVAGELGTEILVAYRTYFTIGVKGAYIIYNSTDLLDGENGVLKTMSMYLMRPYVGFSKRIG